MVIKQIGATVSLFFTLVKLEPQKINKHILLLK